MEIVLLILGLFIFVGLVVVHEFGHFLAARRSGVEVEEFGIGFPPRAKVLTVKKGTVFTINWLPLGGFVKLKGENDADKTRGSYGSATLKNKVFIMVAGVGMNLATAFLILTFLALVGIPKLIDDQYTIKNDTKIVRQQVLVGFVEPDSPAQKAGLQLRDVVESVGPTIGTQSKVTSLENFPKQTKELAGQKVTLVYSRKSVTKSVDLQLRSVAEVESSKNSQNPKGYAGVAPTEYSLQRSTWSAPIVAIGLIKQFTVLTMKGLGTAVANLFRGNTAAASEQVSGPIGIFVLIKDGSLLGYQFVLMIMAVISLTLAIMNILPIPALDGGRLFVTLAYRAIRKPLNPKTEDRIHGSGFIALMLLFVLITVVDIRRIF
ncbi:MAG: M50 family metallopeptidase [Candidatus Saccharibacteria bacterium]